MWIHPPELANFIDTPTNLPKIGGSVANIDKRGDKKYIQYIQSIYTQTLNGVI